MSHSREKIISRTQSRGSLTNNNNQSQYSNEFSLRATSFQSFPIFVHQTLVSMLQKIIELIHIVMNDKDIKKDNKEHDKVGLINLTQKKKLKQANNYWTPPIGPNPHYQIGRSQNKINLLKTDFQRLKDKVNDYKSSGYISKAIAAESPIKNSFITEDNQFNLIRIQEDCQKQFKQIKDRIETIEQDLGEILLLYKELIFTT